MSSLWSPRGDARGGGIFDVAFPFGPEGPPGGPLVLQASKVTANRLNGTAGITLQGGGIYIQGEPITLTNSVITQNVPISASAANRKRQATKRRPAPAAFSNQSGDAMLGAQVT